jgi:hypothetical protein
MPVMLRLISLRVSKRWGKRRELSAGKKTIHQCNRHSVRVIDRSTPRNRNVALWPLLRIEPSHIVIHRLACVPIVIGVELEATGCELDVFAAHPLGRYDKLTLQLTVHLSGSRPAGLRPFHVSNLCVCAVLHGYIDGEIVGVVEAAPVFVDVDVHLS